jgi:hypothetical protein
MLVLVVGAALHSRSSGVAKPKPLPLPLGIVKLDVSPWAKIKEIRNIKTQEQVKLSEQFTPLELPLPPGDYEGVLENPTLGSMPFTLHVDASTQQEVRKAFSAFDSKQVLKDYR